jgi:hypothetical protein
MDSEKVQQWVEEYTTRQEPASSTFAVRGTKAEQEFAWAQFEWQKLDADFATARTALQDINQLGDHLEECLLDKKKYLLSIVKAHERMAKKRMNVSNQKGDWSFHSFLENVY